MKKRAAFYLRCSTGDQHTETQELDLRQLAAQRGLEIVEVYADYASGAKTSRPALDRMMADARRGKFDVMVVWASDRLARSVTHFLEVLDELNHLSIEFVSFREQLDTGGPLGRAVVVIISAIAELERNLIIERVKAGLRRAKAEGRRLGRPPLAVDREAVLQDRQQGMSIRQLAQRHGLAETTVRRLLRQAQPAPPKTLSQPPLQPTENTALLSAL
ncbi:MAG: recombinase family protein [Acidobacteria bacterium]|nr:recombinase family protein [Acidobacteriota bacterium]